MNSLTLQHRLRRTRRGTTAVETAFVLPVFLMFVLGIIEFGHAQMVNHLLRSACRSAVRFGSTDGISTAQARQRVLDQLGSVINPSAVTVYVKNASVYDQGGTAPTSASALEALPNIELSTAEPRTLFLVRAKVNYSAVSVVPLSVPFLGNYLDNLTLQGQSFTRHE